MREQPTWRIPFGILLLFAALIIYAVAVAAFVPDIIGNWHVLFQTVIYVVLGVIWLLPLKRFLIWMETGNWSPPD
ncbi:MAG: DUF2842 domain-containing protein [Sphingomonadales bacterium]|nr:MAG: DUF2842 domain-containing protein [Sphingomonadales bacterium]